MLLDLTTLNLFVLVSLHRINNSTFPEVPEFIRTLSFFNTQHAKAGPGKYYREFQSRRCLSEEDGSLRFVIEPSSEVPPNTKFTLPVIVSVYVPGVPEEQLPLGLYAVLRDKDRCNFCVPFLKGERKLKELKDSVHGQNDNARHSAVWRSREPGSIVY